MTDPASPTPPFEHIGFRLGLKPALRLCPGTELVAQRIRAEARGLATRVHNGRGGREILYIARDEERAAALAEAETRSLGGTDASFEGHRELGRLLGYPRCCVEAFITRLDQAASSSVGTGEDYQAVEHALGRTLNAHGRLNPAPLDGQSSLVSHYPCRFDCELSLRYAEAIFGEFSRRWPRRDDEARGRLMTPVAFTAAGIRVPADAAPEGAVTLHFDCW